MIAVLVTSIALSSCQVPANRIGYGRFDLGQLKVIQEVITMVVFMGFAAWYMKRPVSLDFGGPVPRRRRLLHVPGSPAPAAAP